MVEKKNKILVFGIVVVLALAGLALALGNLEITSGSASDNDWKVYCSGTVEVDAFGIGDPELDPPPTCRIEECKGGFTFSILPSVESGNIKLSVNDQIVQSTSFDSLAGENSDFTLNSGCTAKPDFAEIILTDEAGNEVPGTRKRVNFQ